MHMQSRYISTQRVHLEPFPLLPPSLLGFWTLPRSESHINIHGSAGCVCAMAVSLAFDPTLFRTKRPVGALMRPTTERRLKCRGNSCSHWSPYTFAAIAHVHRCCPQAHEYMHPARGAPPPTHTPRLRCEQPRSLGRSLNKESLQRFIRRQQKNKCSNRLEIYSWSDGFFFFFSTAFHLELCFSSCAVPTRAQLLFSVFVIWELSGTFALQKERLYSFEKLKLCK